jgi:hypothetical protein
MCNDGHRPHNRRHREDVTLMDQHSTPTRSSTPVISGLSDCTGARTSVLAVLVGSDFTERCGAEGSRLSPGVASG